MNDSLDEGLRLNARGDHVADLEDQLAPMQFDGQSAARIDPVPAPFDIRRIDHPLAVVFALSGELDLATAPLLHEQLERTTRVSETVVVDLSGVQFIDSSGLHVLVQAERQLRASGGRLVLVSGPRRVRRIFELTDLVGYFEWSMSVAAALRTACQRPERRRDSSIYVPGPAKLSER
jgi:anti-anti-sigma factor